MPLLLYTSDLLHGHPKLVKLAIFHGLCFFASESPSEGTCSVEFHGECESKIKTKAAVESEKGACTGMLVMRMERAYSSSPRPYN